MQSTTEDKRDLHRVSTKAILFTPDKSHVLVMHMYKGTDREVFALPGGHVDEGEEPDETIIREIYEELGVQIPTPLTHLDFFIHESKKVVLAYIGTLAFDTPLAPPDPSKEYGVWLTKSQFEVTTLDAGYKRVIKENWA